MARKPSYEELKQRIKGLERQLAEGKRVSKKPPHLRLFESLEQINEVIRGATDLDQMMSGVLEVVLSILACDRAWLIFPCDPDAPTWSVPMERTRPEYPGAFSLGKEIATTPEMAEQFRVALELKRPIAFDPSSGRPVPDSARKFSTQSAIIMALYPKTGKPWLWGLSQCSHPRIWTDEDRRLFFEISLRLTDALSSLLFLRSLRESEEKYRLLVESAGEGIILTQEGNVRYMNPRAIESLGYPQEEILSRSMIRFVHPDDRERLAQLYLSKVEGKEVPPGSSWRIIDRSGTVKWVQSRSTLLTWEGKPSLLTFLVNITQQKEAEEALRESEERYRRITAGLTDYTYTVRVKDGRAVETTQSPACETVTGYTAEEFAADPYLWIRMVAEEDRDRVIEHVRGVYEGKESTAIEHRIVRKDGEIRWVSYTTISQTDPQGRLLSYDGVVKDITERKRAEEALRQSEATLQSVFRAVPVGISIMKNRIYQSVNDFFRESLGYPEQDLIGKTPRMLYESDEEYERMGRELYEPLQERGVTSVETRMRRSDGIFRDVVVTVAPLRVDDPSAGTVGVIHDVTERKRAEEALRDAEAKYSAVVTQAKDGVLIIQDNVLQFVNKAMADMLGYTPAEMENTTIIDYIAPESRRSVVGRLEARRAGRDVPSVYEARLQRKDGTIIDAELSASIIEYRGKPADVGLIRNITERKRMEETLRESEARFRSAFENAAVGMALVSPDGIYLEVNMTMARMIGYTPAELIGKPVADFTHPEDLKRRAQFIDDLLAGRIDSGEQERRFMHRNGSDVWVLIWASVQRDSQGRPLNFISLIIDNTSKKKAEEETKRLEAQLQQARKMEAIGTLAGGIAHDFNNLLMGIQGRATLMLADMDSSGPHFEHLRGIEEYVRSAADLTKQLLGFARGGKYEVKATDLNELTDRSANLFGRTKKEITIHRKFQADLWTVEVDRRQVEQVLLNLFVNAWQAMPAGGEVYLQTRNVVLDEVYVKPHGVKPGKYVKISVTDTGVGMDEQTKQRMFDPFFTTKGMGRGTGLGLASAYGIIKNHDGIITVYSEKGHGSTFNIYLPASGKGVSAEEGALSELVMGEGVILLVDDEEMILEVGRPLLEKLGYKVLLAKSGKEAIDLYRENMDRIKMVILDMVMPQMSGGETFDQLRSINPRVKVLLSSGYSINGQAQEILNRGCHGFIQKPFNLMELSQRLGAALSNWRRR